MKAYNTLLHTYKNGNYYVKIYSDGSKIRFTEEDDFDASFPESIDIKITNYCDNNCPMCHERSSIDGRHASFDVNFFNTLSKGTELAIGGGNPLSHPNLEEFLIKMKRQGVICNITVNQHHLIKDKKLVQYLINNKLVYGVGISIIDDSNIDEIITFAKLNSNCVIHVIAGIISKEILEKLYDKNLKILFLGYKEFGRGVSYYNNEIVNKINYIKENIKEISSHFYVISFDNLAIAQLDMKNQLSNEEYERHYMGDDGKFTMYIDLVNQKFAKNSISNVRYDLLDNIIDMFKIVKKD